VSRPLSEDEFKIVLGLVNSRAEGMIDDGIYDDMDTALEFAWEMVQDDILTTDLAKWAEWWEIDLKILEVPTKAIADGTKFTKYADYLSWCAEQLNLSPI
jgi:hypothetical protein